MSFIQFKNIAELLRWRFCLMHVLFILMQLSCFAQSNDGIDVSPALVKVKLKKLHTLSDITISFTPEVANTLLNSAAQLLIVIPKVDFTGSVKYKLLDADGREINSRGNTGSGKRKFYISSKDIEGIKDHDVIIKIQKSTDKGGTYTGAGGITFKKSEKVADNADND